VSSHTNELLPWRWSENRQAWTAPNMRVELQVPLGLRSQTRLLRALEYVAGLTRETRFVNVAVQTLGYLSSRLVLGQCSIGVLDMGLSKRLFSNEKYPTTEFMPIMVTTTNLLYVVAHEWGHGSDFRGSLRAATQHGQCPCRLALPVDCTDYRESYAEAFAEWYLSKGRTTNIAARWYAVRNQWRMVW